MTHKPDTRFSRRMLLPIALARSALSATLMLVVYYSLPFEHQLDASVLVWLVLGIAGLAVGLTFQVRSIAMADAPRLRAAETVATGLPLLLLLYASTYTLLAVNEPGSFNEAVDRTDALYFTMTVFTTVGFGDIVPVTHLARVLTMTQMVIGLITVGVVARLLFNAVQTGMSRRATGESAAQQAEEARER